MVANRYMVDQTEQCRANSTVLSWHWLCDATICAVFAAEQLCYRHAEIKQIPIVININTSTFHRWIYFWRLIFTIISGIIPIPNPLNNAYRKCLLSRDYKHITSPSPFIIRN